MKPVYGYRKPRTRRQPRPAPKPGYDLGFSALMGGIALAVFPFIAYWYLFM